MIKFLRKLGLLPRYAYLRDDTTSNVRKFRIRKDPFGEYVLVNAYIGDYRVNLLADGKTDYQSIWKEWREG